MSAEESLLTHDSCICAIPFKITDFDWDRDRYSNSDGISCYVGRGVDFLVASAALDILSLATNGRMTSQRIWRMVMHEPLAWYKFEGVDYYGVFIPDPRIVGELPIPTPGSDASWGYYPENLCKIVGGLEALGDSELIRHYLIWEGKYWVWMNPDWYAPILVIRLVTLQFMVSGV